MQKRKLNNQGFGLVGILVAVFVLVAIGAAGYLVWQKNHDDKKTSNTSSTSKTDTSKNSDTSTTKDGAASWTSVTTQGGAFTMRVPDGWQIVKYPADFLGSTSVTYKAGTSAVVGSSSTEYAGDSLRFRASVADVTDTGLGPQWSSPQPGLTESSEDYSIGSLHGKRYKGVFTGDLDQTVYEYIFSLSNNKKLDIVYTVYHDQGEVDDVATVEKAIKTITVY